MKARKITLMIAALSALFLVRCGEDENYVEPTLEVSPLQVELEPEVSTTQITLSTNREWKVTSSADWLAVQPASGTEGNNMVVTLTATANESESPREATVKVEASSLVKTVTVAQKGKTGAAIEYVTIADLYQRYEASGVTGENPYTITEDIRLQATCIYDLEGGNSASLKNSWLQDATGGMAIRTTANNGYTAGQQITIRLKDATLSKYQGVGKPQLNFSNEAATVAEGQLPAPKELTIDQVVKEAKYHSMYVKLKDVEFVKYSGLTYHDASSTASGTSRTITSCGENTMDVRTTKYAAFKDEPLPAGKGDLVGIVTLYQYSGGDIVWQFSPSNAASDDAMSNDPATRCSGTPGTIPSTATRTDIANVVKAYANGAAYGEDHYIEGEVLANPANGNIPTFVVYMADGTAGLALTFTDEKDAIVAALPVGAKVQVYVKGTVYNNYNGLIQLGDKNSLSVSMTKVVEATASKPLAPKAIGIADLVDRAYQAELVSLDMVQFTDITKTYNGTVTLEDKSGATVPVYTRKDATFSAQTVKQGSGKFIGVVTNFNGPQLLIRDLKDLDGMTGERFQQEEPPVGETKLIDLAEARALALGEITADVKIKGVVTSDKETKNLDGKNLYLQDAKGAILLRFAANHNYAQGRELEVRLTGAKRENYNGLAQISGLSPDHVLAETTGSLPEPKEVTIPELQSGKYESQLIQLSNVQFETVGEGLTYNGTRALIDAKGNKVDVYTRKDATFAGSGLPTGSGTIVANASVYNSVQLILRGENDVEFKGARFTPEEKPVTAAAIFFSEYIEGSSNNKYLELYNPTDADVELTGYYIVTCTNGADQWSTYKCALDGKTIKAKSTFVLKHNQAALYEGEAMSSSNGLGFNGNDPVGLFLNDKLVDVIGVLGGGDKDFAKDVTLRRKASVTGPYVSASNGWNPDEWETFAKDDVSGLGKR